MQTVDRIMKEVNGRKEVVELYVKIRFFHRIKVLNRKLRDAKDGENRNFKQMGQFKYQFFEIYQFEIDKYIFFIAEDFEKGNFG